MIILGVKVVLVWSSGLVESGSSQSGSIDLACNLWADKGSRVEMSFLVGNL